MDGSHANGEGANGEGVCHLGRDDRNGAARLVGHELDAAACGHRARLHGRTLSLSSSGRSSWAIVARIPLTNPLESSVEYSLASSTASEMMTLVGTSGRHPSSSVAMR